MPRGYKLNYSDFIWIIIICIAVFVFYLFSDIASNEKDLSEFIKFVKGISIFVIIMTGFALYKFYKTIKMRKQRKWCIENALYSVEGIPVQIKEECIDYRGRIRYEIPNIGVTMYYRIIVTYKNPVTDKFEKAESELYYKNPERFLENAEIVVYIRKNPQPLIAVYKK